MSAANAFDRENFRVARHAGVTPVAPVAVWAGFKPWAGLQQWTENAVEQWRDE